MKRLLVAAALLFGFPAHAEVTIDWVTVGGSGNACDTQPQGCFGAVTYIYQVSKYEVTNAQYTEFLNAVAATDTYALYVTSMGSPGPGIPFGCGITRSGSSGSYSYTSIAGREDIPVNYVSFYDALRFANWLHNGQPTGAQDNTTTEDGAYTMITEGFPDGPFITRKTGAKVFLTSEDDWYKAAYYDTGSASYFDYPAGTDDPTVCELPPGDTNSANCDEPEGDLTDVGSYTGSASPYGTFDQGGNVWEWNETLIGFERGLRGGDFYYDPGLLAASFRFANYPGGGVFNIGFRVASTVPPVPSMSPAGLLLVAAGLLGFGAYSRGRA